MKTVKVNENQLPGGWFHHKPTISQRPSMPETRSQMDTRYVNMLLALDSIPRFHNILASFFTWILLAGFVLFPGTFSSLEKIRQKQALSGTQEEALNAIEHVPLFVVAFVCCGLGAAGMCFLWWRWMNNYVWLINRIFLPGTLNSLAGLISSLVNVYSQQDGTYSIPSKITLIVTGVSCFICGMLTLIYGMWKLSRVKKSHRREMGLERAGTHGEGFLEKVQRKAAEPEPEPGTVV